VLAILLPSVLALGAALRAAVEPATPQQSTPEAKEAAPAQGGAPGAKGLSAEAKESLALLRDVLQHDGRNAGRELLRETVAALAEPASGAEDSQVAYLLELDRLADELGSLEELRKLREAVVSIHEKRLPSDHPDLLRAKQSLGLTRFDLGDVAGAKELFEEVLEARSRRLPADNPARSARMAAWSTAYGATGRTARAPACSIRSTSSRGSRLWYPAANPSRDLSRCARAGGRVARLDRAGGAAFHGQ